MIVPARGLPERVTIYEVGPRDGLQNESALVPTEVKAEFIRRLLAAGLPVVEATSFVHPTWVPQLADAERADDAARRRRAATCPVLVPNERGLDRALELGCRHIAIFGSATETFAQRTSTAASTSSSRCSSRPYAGPATPASTSAPTSRCASATRGRAPCRSTRWSTVGKRLFDLGASQLSLGDTIGVGTAGHVDRAARGVRRGRAARSTTLAMHFHDTYGQALANALRRAARRHHDVRRAAPAASAAAPTPRAPPATSPPRTWSGCSPASASSTASTSTRWSRPAPGWPATSAGPAPPRVVRALGRRVRHNPAHEPESSTCTSVRPRPGRRTSRTGSALNAKALAAPRRALPDRGRR